MRKEKEFEFVVMTKIHALEHLFKAKGQGKVGGINKLLNAVALMQEKTVMFQLVRTELMLALKWKKMENCVLEKEVQHL